MKPPPSLEVKSNSPRVRAVVGAWFWGVVPADEVTTAIGVWSPGVAGVLPGGVSIIIRGAP